MRVINQNVFVDPARTRCVRADCWMHIGRQAASNRLQIFHNPRACPVNVCAVLKYDEDVAIVEHCLSTDRLYVWRCQERRHNGIGDLILDDTWRLTFPVRMNNDFYVRNIRQGIERNVPHAPNPCQGQQRNTGEDKKAIASAPFNNASNHDYIPPVALMVTCLLAMLWPF